MMEYNSYYPAQPGQPPPPTMMNNQHDCSMMSGQMIPTNGQTMMHSSPAPSTPQSVRHTPGPPPIQPHHPQHMGHPMNHQQSSPHLNYHQLPPHPPISHSASPHPSSTPHAQSQPPPRPSTGPSPLHHQSPIHLNGPSPKIQAHGPSPMQLHAPNQIPANSLHNPGMSGVNHPPPSQVMQTHGHSFPSSPMAPQSSPHYGSAPVNHQHIPHPPAPMNHGPPLSSGQGLGAPPSSGYMPAHHTQPVNQDRGSPFYQHIPQTEFRIIELNRRLQSRPRVRGPASPLPLIGSSEEMDWWKRFACDFFDDESTLTLRLPGEDKSLEYTIGRTLIPRYFRSHFDGGVTDLSIKLRNTQELTNGPGSFILDCDQADIITKNIFKHPTSHAFTTVVVHTEGHLILEFISNSFDNLMIRSWKFYSNQCHEYIDRSMTTTGLPNAYLIEPVTRFGLTKTTFNFLKMCMIMEPMQDLMAHHRLTRIDPKSCLKHLLFDRYKVKTIEDSRVQPTKRRKRKANANAGTTNKKTKGNANIMNGTDLMSNSMGVNNSLISPNEMNSGLQNLPLASQDVLVVGEPSMLGADFGDENERRITRLENNQYDSSVELNQQSMTNSNLMNQNQVQIHNAPTNQPTTLSNHVSQASGHDTDNSNGQANTGYSNHNGLVGDLGSANNNGILSGARRAEGEPKQGELEASRSRDGAGRAGARNAAADNIASPGGQAGGEPAEGLVL